MQLELRERVQKAIAKLMVRQPFVGILAKSTWIYYDPSTPFPAYTDGLRIFIGPEGAKMDAKGLIELIAHEVMHIALKHVMRSKTIVERTRLPSEIVNFLADAIVNEFLKESDLLRELKKNAVLPEHVERLFGVSTEGKSLEEIAEELKKRITVIPRVKLTCDRDLQPQPERGKEVQVLNEGDKEDEAAEGGGEEGKAKTVERKVLRAAAAVKAAGNAPAWLERLVSELLRSKVDWRRLLRGQLQAVIGPVKKRTWCKLNRKHPGVKPGRRRLAHSDVVVLVDTSGSIEEKELQQFVSEVFAIAKAAGRKTVVIPWDAAAYEPIEIHMFQDVRKVKLKGGGGTVIAPALRAAEKLIGPTTRVIILSDWDIFDLNDPFVQDWLRKHAHRILAVTTHADPPPYLQSVKIQL